jgi:hypothetical protein
MQNRSINLDDDGLVAVSADAAITERLRARGTTPATQAASGELFGMASQYFQQMRAAGQLNVWAKSCADFLQGVGFILCPDLRNRAQAIRHTE